MILNIFNLYKVFERRGNEFNGVDNVELFAWSGDFSVIYGESGSGKSTLLSMIAGISKPTSGSVVLDGENLFELSDENLSVVRNKKIGYVPQDSVFLPHFTVLENILLPRAIRDFGENTRDTKVARTLKEDEYLQEIFESLGIGNLVNEFPQNLSGGELKRAAIARALVNRPEILIADEPTSNLDDENGKRVFDLFANLAKKGTSVLIATHDARGLRYGDRIYTMIRGKLIPTHSGEYGGL